MNDTDREARGALPPAMPTKTTCVGCLAFGLAVVAAVAWDLAAGTFRVHLARFGPTADAPRGTLATHLAAAGLIAIGAGVACVGLCLLLKRDRGLVVGAALFVLGTMVVPLSRWL